MKSLCQRSLRFFVIGVRMQGQILRVQVDSNIHLRYCLYGFLRAYLGGADGVLVAGCHPGDCHYDKGNYYTRRRFAMFKKIIEDVGLESDRLRLSWISASEGHRYAKVATEFTEKIKKIGENSVRNKIFL